MNTQDQEFNFTVINDDGNEVICDVISLLKDQKSNELFVVYTDYTLNDKDQFNTYLSQLIEKKGKYTLKRIDNRERFNQILKEANVLYEKAIKEALDK